MDTKWIPFTEKLPPQIECYEFFYAHWDGLVDGIVCVSTGLYSEGEYRRGHDGKGLFSIGSEYPLYWMEVPPLPNEYFETKRTKSYGKED